MRNPSKRIVWSREAAAFVLVSVAVAVAVAMGGAPGYAKGKQAKSPAVEQWTAPPEAGDQVNQVAADAASVERGRKLFVQYCAGCHGRGGRGDGPAARNMVPRPADLPKTAKKQRDGEIAWKILQGRGPMPSWEGVLAENEVWDLTNYIRSLKAR